MAGHAAANRDGFTIVEVLLALVLLGFVIMGFQAATGEIIHYAGQGDLETVATHLAEDRLDLIRLDPDYVHLVGRYRGTEVGLPGYPDLTRTTTVVRTNIEQSTGRLDYTTITVAVDGSGLRGPVARTIVVAAP